MNLKIKLFDNFQGLSKPNYATLGSAGMDLQAANTVDEIIPAGKIAIIPTGIAIALDPGYEMQIRPRSGLAAKYGVTVLNSPGTIDADYRGEIKVILINHGTEDFVVSRGMRIAQSIIAKYEVVNLYEVTKLDETVRGDSGFGSTGMN